MNQLFTILTQVIALVLALSVVFFLTGLGAFVFMILMALGMFGTLVLWLSSKLQKDESIDGKAEEVLV